MTTLLGTISYVGEKRHIQIALPLQFVLTSLKECGFSVIETNRLPEKESKALSISGQMDLDSTAFIVCEKTFKLVICCYHKRVAKEHTAPLGS